jgi:hypothetical protein
MGLLDSPAPGSAPAPRTPGLLASTPRRMSLQEWMAKDPAYRAAHPDEAPEGWGEDMTGDGSAGKGAVHGKSYDQMNAMELNDAAKSANSGNILERNIPSLAGMLGPMGTGLAFNALDRSLMGAALNNAGLPNPGDYTDGKVAGAANTGMNVAGGVPNPELAGRGGDIFGGFDRDLAGSVGESPGLYAKGGKVGRKGLLDMDPPGPDNVVIGAKTGERVLNAKQFGSLSKEARAEVERVLKAKGK